MAEDKKDAVETAIDKIKPVLSNLTFGTVMGYCSGAAMQKVGKFLAVTIGIGFIGLQSAASAGYITVDWEKVRIKVSSTVDATGDGKIDAEDAKVLWKKLKAILTNKVPAAGGFSLGFLYGLRYA